MRQTIVANDRELAEALVARVTIEGFQPGQLFIEQDGPDNDVFLLLSGRAAIEINGLEVAVREAGTHVGEMAALDPAASRSASVRAIGEVVAARLSAVVLSEQAQRNPEIWKRLAVDIADRLRQRGRFVRVPNDRPALFIGSSVEALPVARAIQKGLFYDDFSVIVWTDGVFRGGESTIDRLIDAASHSDFAALIFCPDDEVISRGNSVLAPRDNVIFEFGLFAGAIGKERTLLVKPRGLDLKLPTDLIGFNPLEYKEGDSSSIDVRVATVCTDIRETVARLGVR